MLPHLDAYLRNLTPDLNALDVDFPTWAGPVTPTSWARPVRDRDSDDSYAATTLSLAARALRRLLASATHRDAALAWWDAQGATLVAVAARQPGRPGQAGRPDLDLPARPPGAGLRRVPSRGEHRLPHGQRRSAPGTGRPVGPAGRGRRPHRIAGSALGPRPRRHQGRARHRPALRRAGGRLPTLRRRPVLPSYAARGAHGVLPLGDRPGLPVAHAGAHRGPPRRRRLAVRRGPRPPVEPVAQRGQTRPPGRLSWSLLALAATRRARALRRTHAPEAARLARQARRLVGVVRGSP